MEQELTIKMEIISPENAAVMLSVNTQNRKIHETVVRFYAKQMKEGKWRPNAGQPIVFATDGTLIDGQHRLKAVIEAGIPIKMAILRGADKGDFAIIDTGLKRNGADVLSITGVPNDHNICAAIRAYWSLRKGTINGRSAASTMRMGYTNEDMLNEYNSSPDFYQTVEHKSYSIYKQCRFVPYSDIAAIFVLLVKDKNYDIEKARDFFDELLWGAEYKSLAWLRLRLTRAIAPKYEKDKLTPNERRVLLSRAWNAFVHENKEQSRVQCRLSDRPIFD